MTTNPEDFGFVWISIFSVIGSILSFEKYPCMISDFNDHHHTNYTAEIYSRQTCSNGQKREHTGMFTPDISGANDSQRFVISFRDWADEILMTFVFRLILFISEVRTLPGPIS